MVLGWELIFITVGVIACIGGVIYILRGNKKE